MSRKPYPVPYPPGSRARHALWGSGSLPYQRPGPFQSVTPLSRYLRPIIGQTGVAGHAHRGGIKAGPEVLDKMGRFAQGLPHYAHRFGQEAGYAALSRGSLEITSDDVNLAMQEAVNQTHETIRFAYHAATTSPQKDALFSKVSLACALAPRDELGYFAPADVRDPLYVVVGKRYAIPQYVSHLKKFCESNRGPVLESEGEDYRRQYRFINPLMRTYVILRGLQEEIIGEDTIQRFEHADDYATVRGRQARLL